jgi:alkylation response protein AidB-like acyl-CoA dehydrogenase
VPAPETTTDRLWTGLVCPVLPAPRDDGVGYRQVMQRTLFDEEHELFRASFRQFLEKNVVPNLDRWERAGIVDRDLFEAAGEAGFLGFAAPTEFGGGGSRDFRYNLVLNEEIQAAGAMGPGLGITLHTDICLPYFTDLASAEQKQRWLPGICEGSLITAVGMTEAVAGSDLAGVATTAEREGDVYVVNGSKVFITNGINADLVITVVKTDPSERHGGISLLIVERGMEGFKRGRNLDKIGLHAQDTAELFFDDVRVPVANRLGDEGMGFAYLMTNLPQERLSIAASGLAAARAALTMTVAYCKERKAFGRSIGSFQNTRFRLAELATEIEIGQAFIDRCALAINSRELTVEEAAMAKYWCTELQGRAVDLGVQLHGGYGFMSEFPIARAYSDARVTRIYGGTNEIMREIIGRSLDL